MFDCKEGLLAVTYLTRIMNFSRVQVDVISRIKIIEQYRIYCYLGWKRSIVVLHQHTIKANTLVDRGATVNSEKIALV